MNNYKIGITNNLDKRMSQYKSSSYNDYNYKYTCLTHNKKDEKKIHELLQEYRIRNDREFFNLSIDIIIKTINLVIHKIQE